MTPLGYACAGQRDEVVKWLLENKADVSHVDKNVRFDLLVRCF